MISPRTSLFSALSSLAATALLLTGCGIMAPQTSPAEAKTGWTRVASPSASPAPTGENSPSAEGAASSAGDDYVPATSDAPAQNPPIPTVSDRATVLSAEGLGTAIYEWSISHNYAVTTGDSTAAREAINTQTLSTFTDMYDTYDGVYRRGSWIVGGILLFSSAPSSFTETDEQGMYSMKVLYSRSCGSWTIDSTTTYECVEGSNDMPATIYARFTGDRWVIDDLRFPQD